MKKEIGEAERGFRLLYALKRPVQMSANPRKSVSDGRSTFVVLNQVLQKARENALSVKQVGERQ
jgi:hypothetical protein